MNQTHIGLQTSDDTRSGDSPEPPEPPDPPPDPDPSPTSPSDPRAASDPGAPTQAQATIIIEIIDHDGAISAPDSDAMRAHIASACARAGAVGGEIRCKLVDDETMAREHLAHCDTPGTTDVITFNMTDDGDPQLDADLLICLDEAKRQAEQRGHEFVRELTLYALHGVLHCLGESDRDEASFERMHAREDEILHAIGLGATFDSRESGGGAS